MLWAPRFTSNNNELQQLTLANPIKIKDYQIPLIIGSIEADKVGSVVEWLKRRDQNRHGLGSKPTRALLLCPWERHFTAGLLKLFCSTTPF